MDKDLPHAYTQDNSAGSTGSACKAAEHHAKGCMRERWCLHSLKTGCVSDTSLPDLKLCVALLPGACRLLHS